MQRGVSLLVLHMIKWPLKKTCSMNGGRAWDISLQGSQEFKT